MTHSLGAVTSLSEVAETQGTELDYDYEQKQKSSIWIRASPSLVIQASSFQSVVTDHPALVGTS